MERRTLPPRRLADTFELRVGDHRYAYKITVGYFTDGTPAEVFVTGAKTGSDHEATARDGAILISLALQHGIPIDVMRSAVTRDGNGKPSTIVGAALDMLYGRNKHE